MLLNDMLESSPVGPVFVSPVTVMAENLAQALLIPEIRLADNRWAFHSVQANLLAATACQQNNFTSCVLSLFGRGKGGEFNNDITLLTPYKPPSSATTLNDVAPRHRPGQAAGRIAINSNTHERLL